MNIQAYELADWSKWLLTFLLNYSRVPTCFSGRRYMASLEYTVIIDSNITSWKKRERVFFLAMLHPVWWCWTIFCANLNKCYFTVECSLNHAKNTLIFLQSYSLLNFIFLSDQYRVGFDNLKTWTKNQGLGWKEEVYQKEEAKRIHLVNNPAH
jgi:hypothetical protein